MLTRTKYKRYQFVLEWVTLGMAVAWLIAALILLNFYCDQENEILKRNLLMMSIILDFFAYFGFSSMSVLPADNLIIKTRKYVIGDKIFRYKKESYLRNFALISKIVSILIIAFMGLYKYFI